MSRTTMKKIRKLKKGDKVAIVSLSSGILGESFCAHILELGKKRLEEFGLIPVFLPNALKGVDYLKEHPEKRAEDLKHAMMDDQIAGIICAIGGDDTYRTLPFLMEDQEFVQKVKESPKLFTGFSDTTINHLMFYRLGMRTFYGPNFICDLGEMESTMLPYTKKAFTSYFTGDIQIESSEYWYEERTEFSEKQLMIPRTRHPEIHGFEVLQGVGVFEGALLGGCLESLYDILTTNRFADEKEVCTKYGIFPGKAEWENKILFIETCEEKPSPDLFEKELLELKTLGVLEAVEGIIVGKPQDESFYEEYKEKLVSVVADENKPILYNVNFGHAIPRCILPYGAVIHVNLERKSIHVMEEVFCD